MADMLLDSSKEMAFSAQMIANFSMTSNMSMSTYGLELLYICSGY